MVYSPEPDNPGIFDGVGQAGWVPHFLLPTGLDFDGSYFDLELMAQLPQDKVAG